MFTPERLGATNERRILTRKMRQPLTLREHVWVGGPEATIAARVKMAPRLQADLDLWMKYYNEERPHSGRYCYGKTPMQTFNDFKKIGKQKMLDQLVHAEA